MPDYSKYVCCLSVTHKYQTTVFSEKSQKKGSFCVCEVAMLDSHLQSSSLALLTHIMNYYVIVSNTTINHSQHVHIHYVTHS